MLSTRKFLLVKVCLTLKWKSANQKVFTSYAFVLLLYRSPSPRNLTSAKCVKIYQKKINWATGKRLRFWSRNSGNCNSWELTKAFQAKHSLAINWRPISNSSFKEREHFTALRQPKERRKKVSLSLSLSVCKWLFSCLRAIPLNIGHNNEHWWSTIFIQFHIITIQFQVIILNWP